MKPIVYVIKEQAVRSGEGTVVMDYTPALKYGEIEFITAFDLPTHGRGPATDTWKSNVVDFVKKFNPLCDYIVATGQPTSIFAVGWALGTAHKVPRFLVWRHDSASYVPLHFCGDFATL